MLWNVVLNSNAYLGILDCPGLGLDEHHPFHHRYLSRAKCRYVEYKRSIIPAILYHGTQMSFLVLLFPALRYVTLRA